MSLLSRIFNRHSWAKVSLDCRHYALGGANALRKAGFDAQAITYAIDGNHNPVNGILRYHAVVKLSHKGREIIVDPMKTSGNAPFRQVTLGDAEMQTIRPLTEAR